MMPGLAVRKPHHALASIGLALASFEASAQFAASGLIELQGSSLLPYDDPRSQPRQRLFAHGELGLEASLNQHWAIESTVITEPVRDPDGDPSLFGGEGVFIESLALRWEDGPFLLYAGKFNPHFGLAWHAGRGIWSEDFAEDYEITERLGWTGSVELLAQARHRLGVTLGQFMADNTALSDSLVTRRGHQSRADGGAGNTGKLDSYIAALDTTHVFGMHEVGLHLAWRHQQAPAAGTHESGYALTVNYDVALSGIGEFNALLEYVDINHFDASDTDLRMLSVSSITRTPSRWFGAVGYSRRILDAPAVSSTDLLLQLSAGYAFTEWTTLELGWRRSREAENDVSLLGMLLRHHFGG